MLRQWIVVAIVLIIGLQSSTIGFAGNDGVPNRMASTTGMPCPAHAAMLHSTHGDCCSHHSTHSAPASCLAHCAGACALLPSSLTLSLSAARITLEPLVVATFPSERPGPALRPPIA